MGGSVFAISSADQEYQPLTPITGFGNIRPGINLQTGTTVYGTANNSVYLNGVDSSLYARNNIDTTFTANVAINGNLTFTNSKLQYSNNNLYLQNSTVNGDIDLYVTSSTYGNVRALKVAGNTGQVYVNSDPINSLGVATKGYVDTTVHNATVDFNNTVNIINSNVAALTLDYEANITAVNNNITTSINTLQTTLNNNIAALSSSTDARFTLANANAAAQSASISALQADVALKAYIDNPALTGIPTAPTAPAGTNTTQLATTQFVTTAATTLQTDYNTKITNLAATTATNLANGLALKADINSPTLTGAPKSVTPSSGDSSTNIATTAFVQTTVAANKFNYTVATTGPGDTSGLISSTNGGAGNNGDFWFQIG